MQCVGDDDADPRQGTDDLDGYVNENSSYRRVSPLRLLSEHFEDAELATADEEPAPGDGTALQTPRTSPVPLLPALRPVPPTPSKKPHWWLWAGAGVLVPALAFLGYSQIWMGRPPPVAVEMAALAPVTRVLAVNGRMAAVHSVDVRSVVTGNLTTLPVAEGDQVESGQILAQVDAAAQDAIVRQAIAGLDAALVTERKATEANDRAVSLGDDIARSVLETSVHDVRSAAQEVARQTAVLDQATAVLANHTIRAPVSGTVLKLDAEQGQIVGPTIALLTLADLSNLVVEADVDEAYATQIVLNQPAALQLAGETATRAGRVSFVSTRVDVATGGLSIKIAFDSPVTAPIGLTVATNIVVEQRAAALSVPRTAMRTDGDGAGVFVVDDGTARLRPVTVVDWPASRLIVTAGLTEGDLFIVDAAGISDGQQVAVVLP